MDELWDEGAVAGDDAGVGAALLMADLEGAIVAAGDEIASLRRVTEAVPRPGLPARPAGGETARPEAESGELARASQAPVDGAHALRDVAAGPAATEPLPRMSSEAAAAAGLPVQAAPVGASVGSLDRVAPIRAVERGLQAPAAAVADRFGALPQSAVPSSTDTALKASAPIGGVPDRLPTSHDQVADVALADAAASAPLSEQSRDLPSQRIADQPEPPRGTDGVGQAAPVRSLGSSAPAAGVAGAPSSDRASAGGQEAGETPHDGTRSGPTEGDVYLDGERVGRWMARHLAHELGGPQAAGTGFDPRLGPAWPGSLHGN